MEEIINRVSSDGVRIGAIEKIEAHTTGVLHEAFSIFIFNNKGQVLLQKRSPQKYHSAGLWSNTCCGHARKDENLIAAANRRLKEEMGFNSELKRTYSFTYKVNLSDGMIENEYDYVLIGYYNGTVSLDSNEAEDYCWLNVEEFKLDVTENPAKYTYWVKEIVKRYCLLRHVR